MGFYATCYLPSTISIFNFSFIICLDFFKVSFLSDFAPMFHTVDHSLNALFLPIFQILQIHDNEIIISTCFCVLFPLKFSLGQVQEQIQDISLI